MSERERQRTQERAVVRGRQARRAGKPIDANPYKMSEYGAGGFWRIGWQEEDERAWCEVCKCEVCVETLLGVLTT